MAIKDLRMKEAMTTPAQKGSHASFPVSVVSLLSEVMLHRLFAFVNAEQFRGARLISGHTLTLSTKMDIAAPRVVDESVCVCLRAASSRWKGVCVCGCVCAPRVVDGSVCVGVSARRE